MSRERKGLLIVLEFLALGWLWQAEGGTLKEERILLKEKILLNHQLKEGLRGNEGPPEKKSLQLLEIEQDVYCLFHLFDADPDLYRMGQNLKCEWQKRELILTHYGERENEDGRYLEYNMEGQPSSILSFLESPGFPVRISYFTLDAQKSPSRICLGISPAELPEELTLPPGYQEELVPVTPPARQCLSSELAALFPRQAATTPLTKQLNHILPETVQKEADPTREKPLLTDSLTYVGRIETHLEGVNYGFKEKASGKIILVSPKGAANEEGWLLKESSETLFILVRDNIHYRINK